MAGNWKEGHRTPQLKAPMQLSAVSCPSSAYMYMQGDPPRKASVWINHRVRLACRASGTRMLNTLAGWQFSS